jgi:hypothetical protein
MPFTHEQKCDAGQRLLAEVNRRIDVRKKAKEIADNIAGGLAHDRAELIKGCSERWLKTHKITAPLFKPADEDSHHLRERYTPCLRMATETGCYSVNLAEFPAFEQNTADTKAAAKRKQELCAEIEFLHCLLAPNVVAAFQSHVARLVSLPHKDSRIGESELRPIIEGFIDSRRPVVCTLK